MLAEFIITFRETLEAAFAYVEAVEKEVARLRIRRKEIQNNIF